MSVPGKRKENCYCFLLVTIIHIILNAEKTITATNKLIACFQKIWQKLHYFEVMFSGYFLVEIFILCDKYHLSPLEFPYAYTVVSDKEVS